MARPERSLEQLQDQQARLATGLKTFDYITSARGTVLYKHLLSKALEDGVYIEVLEQVGQRRADVVDTIRNKSKPILKTKAREIEAKIEYALGSPFQRINQLRDDGFIASDEYLELDRLNYSATESSTTQHTLPHEDSHTEAEEHSAPGIYTGLEQRVINFMDSHADLQINPESLIPIVDPSGQRSRDIVISEIEELLFSIKKKKQQSVSQNVTQDPAADTIGISLSPESENEELQTKSRPLSPRTKFVENYLIERSNAHNPANGFSMIDALSIEFNIDRQSAQDLLRSIIKSLRKRYGTRLVSISGNKSLGERYSYYIKPEVDGSNNTQDTFRQHGVQESNEYQERPRQELPSYTLEGEGTTQLESGRSVDIVPIPHHTSTIENEGSKSLPLPAVDEAAEKSPKPVIDSPKPEKPKAIPKRITEEEFMAGLDPREAAAYVFVRSSLATNWSMDDIAEAIFRTKNVKQQRRLEADGILVGLASKMERHLGIILDRRPAERLANHRFSLSPDEHPSVDITQPYVKPKEPDSQRKDRGLDDLPTLNDPEVKRITSDMVSSLTIGLLENLENHFQISGDLDKNAESLLRASSFTDSQIQLVTAALNGRGLEEVLLERIMNKVETMWSMSGREIDSSDWREGRIYGVIQRLRTKGVITSNFARQIYQHFEVKELPDKYKLKRPYSDRTGLEHAPLEEEYDDTSLFEQSAS